MQRTRVGIGFLLLFGVLGLVQSLLGEWLAPLIEEQLGTYINLWTVGVPFLVIGSGLIGFEIRDRLADQPAATSLSSAQPSSISDSNRTKMIDKVRAIWIDGVLHKSLTEETRIALGLTEQAAAVVRPTDLLLRLPHVDRTLPPDTKIVDVFDELGGALLILGAPGAGKTMLLLELARDLLARTAEDGAHPIPVVFALSSWATRRQPLEVWLSEELHERYDVNRKIARVWVESDQILPLLDGLDEVAPEHRAACVETINAFHRTRSFLPLVVCSRIADYQALAPQLRLHGAIVVESLTQQQIQMYLARAGRSVTALRAALRDDPTLWELLDTPLMLNILTLTYTGQSVVSLRGSSLAEQRSQIFSAYVDQMLPVNHRNTPYTRGETVRWLAWLAWQMRQHNETVFYLERLQHTWLPYQQQRILRLLLGLSFGLLFGQSFGLLFGQSFGLGVGLVSGVFVGLLIGLPSAVFIGLIAGLASGLFVRSWSARAIKPADTVQLSCIGMIGGLIIFGLLVGVFAGLIFGPLAGTVFGLAFGLIGGVFVGLSGTEVEHRTQPNQGIHRSAQTALRFGLAFSLAFGLVWGLAFSLAFGLVWGSVFGLLGGLSVGLLMGLYYGGAAWLSHYILRFLLVRLGIMPWRYVDFLNFAAQRILLRKVGGGYIFIHGLLLDYFADQYEAEKGKWA